MYIKTYCRRRLRLIWIVPHGGWHPFVFKGVGLTIIKPPLYYISPRPQFGLNRLQRLLELQGSVNGNAEKYYRKGNEIRGHGWDVAAQDDKK